jgi:hypothetical protein
MLFYDQVAKQGHVDSIKTCKLIDCLFTCDDRGRSYIYIYICMVPKSNVVVLFILKFIQVGTPTRPAGVISFGNFYIWFRSGFFY